MNNENDNTQTIDNQIMQQRKADFHEALQSLQKEHGFFIVPILDHSPFAILPKLEYLEKKEYESLLATLQAGAGGNTQQ